MMINKLLIIFALAAAFCAGFFFKTIVTEQSISSLQAAPPIDMPKKKVTGVAGIFFKSKDPGKLKEWYQTHLGFATDEFGARFEWQEVAPGTTKRNVLQWTPFRESTTYFSPSTKDFMINYRVEDLTNLVEQLKKENVTVIGEIETYEYGKFAHILDIEGNKIELFEPNYAYVPQEKPVK